MAACVNNARNATTNETKPVISRENNTPPQLPLPDVPKTMTTTEERAAYVLTHFWDAMDFNDTINSNDKDVIEQNFVNFASIFNITEPDTVLKSFDILMSRAESNPECYTLLIEVAEKYLYDPNSPMLNENAYIQFLKSITKSGFLADDTLMRYNEQLKDALKNQPGSNAADFIFIDTQGKKHTLHDSNKKESYRAILFYDPECEQCKATEHVLTESPILKKAIDNNIIDMLTIYCDGDITIWEKHKNDLPDSWINAYSPDGEIDRTEAYVIRAMPTMYLLAPDNTVILKDADTQTILSAIASLLQN